MQGQIIFSKAEQQKLKSLGIDILYLFGSQAEGMAGDLSDFDFGVVLRNTKKLSSDTNPLYLELFNLLGCHIPSDRLDIVFLQKAPLELRFDVVGHGQVIFESSTDERFDFEEKTVQAYCDFKPILKEFDRAVIEDQ